MISTILLTLIAGAEPTLSETFSAPSARVTGGVLAPASLPAGSNALYGFVGAPELGIGYRQGFGLIELEARGLFNLFEVSVTAEVGLKVGVLKLDRFRLAPTVALGLELNSGARYFDRLNFGYLGLRPRLGVNASYDFTDTISGVAQFEVPISIALTVQGFQVTPLLGAGAEFHLGGSLSLLVTGHAGFDVTQEPFGVAQARAAWAARLGIGYRLF